MGKAKQVIYLDQFDHDINNEPKGLRGRDLDIHILNNAKRVSVFWITETMARASRIQDWQDRGILELDNKIHGFPWLQVVKFASEDCVK